VFNFKEIMKAKLVKENDYHYYLTIDGKIIADTEAHPLSSINVSKLSKQNCDEIFGVVDVEKLADELKVGISYKEYDHLIKRGIIVGFNKAMELNKDKLFTLNDMRKGIQFGEDNTDMDSFDTVISDKEVNEFIQSLQQPTEIEVEIVMGYVGECGGNNGDGCFQDSPGHDCGCFEYIPKLDDNGCLILKKL
jgi:hypothetical protein